MKRMLLLALALTGCVPWHGDDPKRAREAVILCLDHAKDTLRDRLAWFDDVHIIVSEKMVSVNFDLIGQSWDGTEYIAEHGKCYVNQESKTVQMWVMDPKTRKYKELKGKP